MVFRVVSQNTIKFQRQTSREQESRNYRPPAVQNTENPQTSLLYTEILIDKAGYFERE